MAVFPIIIAHLTTRFQPIVNFFDGNREGVNDITLLSQSIEVAPIPNPSGMILQESSVHLGPTNPQGRLRGEGNMAGLKLPAAFFCESHVIPQFPVKSVETTSKRTSGGQPVVGKANSLNELMTDYLCLQETCILCCNAGQSCVQRTRSYTDNQWRS